MKFATNIANLPLGMLLHYLGKLKIQIFCRYGRKRKQIAFLIASNYRWWADGFSGRVKAWQFSILFRWARRKGRRQLLLGRAAEAADVASHVPYCWWCVFQQDSVAARDTVQLLQQPQRLEK